jgi:DNA mismatch endonuclease (patch repair protein)
MDKLTPEQRHKNMTAIKGKNTKPEMLVRRYLWNRGFRYRVNNQRLPGHPDIVLRKYRTCIFVNGCFWHGHEGCRYYVIPKSNTEFWIKKIRRNIERDKFAQQELAKMGWHCITIWECELKGEKREKSLESLAFTLNHIYLQDHAIKYQIPNEDSLLAAEEIPYLIK